MEQQSIDPRTLTIGGTKDSRTSLRVVDHKFIIGKEEFYPFVAEMHYYRIPKRYWSICFERIRKAEFRIISTSVPWNLHEARQGDFDFAGVSDQAKDLIVFLELCREFGFKIVLRPGPWIASEWDRGGIPDFAVRHGETVAVGPDGRPLMADPGGGVKPSQVPSYLSPRFHILLKNYFSVFAEVVKNYIYPRGPVFMIELDHETSFGGHFDPFSGDYNPQGTLSAYPKFLEEKYESLDRLNKSYKLKMKTFGDISAPTEVAGKSPHDLLKALDWVEFREWAVNRYAEVVAGLVSQTEISALFSRSLAFDGSYSFPDVAGARTGGRTIFTVNLGWDCDFSATIRRARAVSGWQATGFCSSLSLGHRHADPEAGHEFQPISAADTKRLLVAALAGGLKGFNFHMFVGRSNWYDSALGPDGAILPSYEVVRDALAHLLPIRYEVMKDFAATALVQYRPYLRATSLGSVPPYDYLNDLVGSGFNDLTDDLGALAQDYRLFDLTVGARLNEYQTLVVPVAEFMDADAQGRLLELIQDGAHVILYGLLPKTDTAFKSCEILSKGIGMRTTSGRSILAVEARKQQFGAHVLGTISKVPAQAVKLATAGAKVLAATTTCGKGRVSVMTFSPGSRLLPAKLAFLEDLLALGKHRSPVSSSDPRIHVVAQAHNTGALLMVYDASVSGSVGHSESEDEGVVTTFETRPVIISADWKAMGLPSARTVTLTDILGTEVIKTSVKDLAVGIELRFSVGDSRLFYLEKKS